MKCGTIFLLYQRIGALYGYSEELKLIAEQLGDFPLAGFFANGEFYPGRLYSYTGVLPLFL